MNEEMKGAFYDSLTRNNKQIKSDRAVAIMEDAQMLFKRRLEDLEITQKRLIRARDNMLDLSPENSLSLKPAKDFDADEYVEQELKYAIDIRNNGIKIEECRTRYNFLFGGV